MNSLELFIFQGITLYIISYKRQGKTIPGSKEP
jgi:hypothetical protein